MMHWTRARGHEVVDKEEAETIGHLDALVIDPSRHRIEGLVVGQKVLSWSDAQGVGPDAVTVPGASTIRDASSPLEAASVAGTADPIAKPMFTEHGFEIGVVRDLTFDAQSGEVEQIILEDDATVDGGRLIGIGSFAVVVAADDTTPGHRG